METARVIRNQTAGKAEAPKLPPVVAARSATPAARPATLIQTAGPAIGLSNHAAAVAPASASAGFSQAVAESLGGGHEEQADRAADVALRMPAFSSPAAGGSPRSHARIAAAPSSGYPGLGGGRQLSAPIRNQFEHAYGWDFSGVRLHTGSSAVAAAQCEGAKAFTSGHDIAFGSQVSDPEAGTQRHLLAHELAHVVQQSKSAAPPVAQPAASRVAAAKPLAASLSAVPSGRVQRSPTVTAVNLPAPADLGLGGSIAATAVAPAGAALVWTLVGAGAGVTDVADGRPLGRSITATMSARAGRRFRIQAALASNRRDRALSAEITLVGITGISFRPDPPFQTVSGNGFTSVGPANTAEPNRAGLAGNKANVIVRTAPPGPPIRPATVTLPTALGAAVAGNVITPGSATGEMIVQVTDNTTGTSQRATLIVNPVPAAVGAFIRQTGTRRSDFYGCQNLIGWTWSDPSVRVRNRFVGETVVSGARNDLGFIANNGFNPLPTLVLAAPANSWNDWVGASIGPKTGAAGDSNIINVNRYVGPGVALPLPRVSDFTQGFSYSGWHTGALWSSGFDSGTQRRSLVQDGTAFIWRSEHIFPGATARVFNEAYKGPPLIRLSNIRVTPLTPAARALADDNTAIARIRVATNVPGRRVVWGLAGGVAATLLAPSSAGTAVPVAAPGRVKAGAATGSFTIRAADSVFGHRQFDGTGTIVAVALNLVSPLLQTIAAGVRRATIDLMAEPGGRIINWTLDAGAIAGGVRLTRPSPSGGAAPNRRATITRPASFIGTVTVTAVDSILPARTRAFTINFL